MCEKTPAAQRLFRLVSIRPACRARFAAGVALIVNRDIG
jgi:hypothetical protein